MPPDLHQTKRICHLIGTEANIGDGGEEYDLETSDFGKSNLNNPDTGMLLGQPMKMQIQMQTQEMQEGLTNEDDDGNSRHATVGGTGGSAQVSMTIQSASASTSALCHYQQDTIQEQFLELMHIQITCEAEACEADHSMIRDIFATLVSGIGAVLNGCAVAKRKHHDDSDESSYLENLQ